LFDKYYSDHFGLRELFNEYYKLIKFKLGDSPSNDVTIGKDGWLFLGSIKKGYKKYGDPMGDARNVNLYSESDLKKFGTYMVALQKWLKDKGIEYVLVIAPNKHTIYFDKLPDYISKVNPYSSTDQLVDYLKSHTNVPVVDLRKVLIEKKNENQLYYKTDTHWNHYGANIAQYEIMLQIEKLFPGLISPEMVLLKQEVGGGGDLSSFMGVTDFTELQSQPIFHNTCNPVKYPKDAKPTDVHSFFCDDQKLSAVIFRDSFFSALQPYFSRKFKRSTYISKMIDYSLLEKYVSSENPDIVIEEWVERKLPYVPIISPELSRSYHKKQFECSNKLIFFNDFRELTYKGDLKQMDGENKSMIIKSTTKNPIIKFPPLPFEKGVQYIVHIQIKSSINSTLKLFYSDIEVEGYPFSENNSVRVSVKSGENDIYILLDYDKLGKWLRLDPITGVGEIEINTIEIKRLENNSITKCTHLSSNFK
jgi:alginate O-acetyltransferase complex protein AlgJ